MRCNKRYNKGKRLLRIVGNVCRGVKPARCLCRACMDSRFSGLPHLRLQCQQHQERLCLSLTCQLLSLRFKRATCYTGLRVTHQANGLVTHEPKVLLPGAASTTRTAKISLTSAGPVRKYVLILSVWSACCPASVRPQRRQCWEGSARTSTPSTDPTDSPDSRLCTSWQAQLRVARKAS